MMTPLITALTRASLHDGKGIRTVVYFKGCSLSCRWCHNPETISPKTEILYYPQKCINCGRCIALCPKHNIFENNRHLYKHSDKICAACMEGAHECPNDALQICGEFMTPKKLFSEIIKDKAYYDRSGGGVTFSGGECLLYPAYLEEILLLCQKADVHTAVESAFHVPWENIGCILPYVNTFLIDIKHSDTDIHEQYTGHGNEQILDNIRKLSKIHDDIWIRVPLIPGVNDDDKNLTDTAALIKSFGKAISKVELLSYNNLASGKYDALMRPFTDFGHPQDEKELQKMNAFFGK